MKKFNVIDFNIIYKIASFNIIDTSNNTDNNVNQTDWISSDNKACFDVNGVGLFFNK